MGCRCADFVPMNNLLLHRGYRVEAFGETFRNAQRGLFACVTSNTGQSIQVLLPQSYVTILCPGQLDAWKTDIEAGNFPYLVFRGTNVTRNHMFDLVMKSEESDAMFASGLLFPEEEAPEDDFHL